MCKKNLSKGMFAITVIEKKTHFAISRGYRSLRSQVRSPRSVCAGARCGSKSARTRCPRTIRVFGSGYAQSARHRLSVRRCNADVRSSTSASTSLSGECSSKVTRRPSPASAHHVDPPELSYAISRSSLLFCAG